MEEEGSLLLNGIKKRRVAVVICIAIFAAISFGIFSTVKGYQEAKAMQIPDANGESKSLHYITDEMIKDNTQNYYSIKRYVIRKGERSGVEGYFKEEDRDYVRTRIQSLSGFYVCNAFLGDGNPLALRVDSMVYSGNLRIVLTDEENNILYDIPIDKVSEIQFETDVSKLYYVKLIAESANLLVLLERG